MSEPLIRSISDTARWVAYHRAIESDRPDSIFRDPYARRLAGERGARIGRELHENAWAVAIRTYLFDLAIQELLSRKLIDMVVNLGAGLDSRPYRLELSHLLRWIEIDVPEIVDVKRRILSNEKPHCQLEVIAENLGDERRRRTLFSQLDQRSQQILVISEGLLIYLDEDKVTSLAADLHAQPHFSYWLVEVVSPTARDWMNWKWSRHLCAANARMGFAPYDWRRFYRERGWELVAFRNLSQTARELNREPPIMKLFRFIGELYPSWGQMQAQLWESGVALLRRA
jgi:methyltransferase (TIGR00027 family)